MKHVLVASDFDKCATVRNTGFKAPFDRKDPFLNPKIADENIKQGYHAVHDSASNTYFSIVTMHRDIRVVEQHLKVMFREWDLEKSPMHEVITNEDNGKFYLDTFYLVRSGENGQQVRKSVPIYVAYLPCYGDDGNDLESYHANQKKVKDKVLMIETIENKYRVKHGICLDEINFFDDKRKNVESVFNQKPPHWHCFLADHQEEVVASFTAHELYAINGEIKIDKRPCVLDTQPREVVKMTLSQRLFADRAAVSADDEADAVTHNFPRR